MSKERAAQLVEAGIWLKLSGDVEGAQKLFQRALKLDPGNEKATQLLASMPPAAPSAPSPAGPATQAAPAPPPAEVAPVEPSPAPVAVFEAPAADNPFERPAESAPPSATETEWGLATGFKPNPAVQAAPAAAPVKLSLDDDWGRFTGATTPLPAGAPPPASPVPMVVTSSDSSLRAGGGVDGPAPRHTLVQFSVGEATPPAPAPRNTLVDFTVSDLPPAAPAPRNTLVQFSVGDPPPPETAPRNTLVQFSVGELPPAGRAALADFSLPPVASAPLALQPESPPAAPWPFEPAPGAASEPQAGLPPPAPAVAVEVEAEAQVPWVDAPLEQVSPEPPPAVEPPTAPAPRRTTGMFGLPPTDPGAPLGSPAGGADWRFSDSGVNAAPMGWDLPPPPAAEPSAPVLEAVQELVPSPEAMAVPVPPPPVPDVVPVSSPPMYAETPVPTAGFEASPPASLPFDLPPQEDAMSAIAVPPPAPSAPGVQADLASRHALFGSAGSAPAPSPPEPAWAWSGAAPPPDVTPAEWAAPPEPRPSPSLAPAAESAWDQRSNPGVKLPVVPGRDKALDLISSDSKISRPPEARTAELQSILKSARNLLDLDDHTGAMELIVKAQALAPEDLEVQVLRERSERTLLTMLESKLGPLGAVPRVLLKDDEIIWLNLDHRAGFVLAQIDGSVNFDDLFSVSGMTRLDTARILAQLIDEGVISRG